MALSFLRTTLGLLAAALLVAAPQAQSDADGPYGLQDAQIQISYAEGGSGPATVDLTSEHPIESDQILLTLSDGRRDYDLRLRRSRDGSFSARADLPAAPDLRSLRLGTGDEGRNSFLMPQVEDAGDGTLSGSREGNGFTITITITKEGKTTIEFSW